MGRRKAPAGCFWREGILYGRIQTNGRDIKWSLRTDDPAVAKSRRKAERARVIAAERYGDHRRTFAEALDAWSRFIVNEVSAKTITRYSTSLTVLQPFLEGLYLDQIDKKLIGAIVASRRDVLSVPRGKLKAIKVSIATIKRDLTALSSVLGFACDEEWMDVNPVMAWLKPGGRHKSRLTERRDPIMLPSHQHVQMVIDRCGDGLFGKMIRAAVMTGARLDELGQANRQNLDRKRRQLTIVGKRNKLRTIDLEDAFGDLGWTALESLPVSLETNALFWYRQKKGARLRGQPAARRYSQISSNFRRLVRSVAIQAQKQEQGFRPFTFHHLRHLHAVDFLKSGRSIYSLQRRLGHTSIKTTEMYLAYLTPEEVQSSMAIGTASGSKTGSRAAVGSVEKQE